ncbi:ion channel [Gordonia sp. CPCC 205515]|uniref:potassium channel family protein n=1 Tax=Gordonia sp. CPCC 205515 TaxID=3140791 RepID=UPI003AF374BB
MTEGVGSPANRLKEAGRRAITMAIIRPIAVAVILLVGYFVLPINKAADANLAGLIVGGVLFTVFCWWEVRHFNRSKYPVATAIEMLVAIAAFYIVVFAVTYYLFSEYDPGSFNADLTRIDALYFCLTVFTTTGFGDIAAVSQGARIAVSIQMVSTLVLLGLGIRFLNVLVNSRVAQVSNAVEQAKDTP